MFNSRNNSKLDTPPTPARHFPACGGIVVRFSLADYLFVIYSFFLLFPSESHKFSSLPLFLWCLSLQNSIRHNLSLHNRFMRVQNEGTGKSSWWMLNPDAKPGKSVRRRAASMETSKYEKRRGRVRKRVEAIRQQAALGLASECFAVVLTRKLFSYQTLKCSINLQQPV